jgi:hypothetical protein
MVTASWDLAGADNAAMDESTAATILSPQHAVEVIERAEVEAQAAMKLRYETAKWIAEQANTTLTVLLAGIGGALAFAVKVFGVDPPTVVDKSSAVLCGYLVLLALGLVFGCLTVAPIPAIHNEPRSWLYAPGMRFAELRQLELKNLQERLDLAHARNERRAIALNVVRVLAALSPVVFGLSAWHFS